MSKEILNVVDAVSKAYEEFQIMFDMNPEKTTKAARGYYVDNLLRNYINKGEREKAQTIIDEASKYATGPLVDKLNDYQKDLFGSPEDVIAYYKPILESEPQNIEALKALWKAVHKAAEIPLEAPKNQFNKTSTKYEQDVKYGSFSGFISHYHVSKRKIDCAGLEITKLLEEVKDD